MKNVDKKVIQEISESISQLLSGNEPHKIILSVDIDSTLKRLGAIVNKLINTTDEAGNYINLLARGKLDIESPRNNFFASPYKQLHANLRHLRWQLLQIASGDFSQNIDFMGDFEESINTLIESLHEKKKLEKSLRNSHAFLESRIQERTADLAITNKFLKSEIQGALLFQESCLLNHAP